MEKRNQIVKRQILKKKKKMRKERVKDFQQVQKNI